MSEPLPVTAPAAPATVPAAAAGLMARRFRGYLPVAIDVECGGFHAATDALLEIAAVLIDMDADGTLRRGDTHSYHVQPFAGARLDPAALSITGIDPWHPLRPALPERDALQRIFREIRHAVRAYQCRRAILVGHNAAFDLGFLNAAVARAEVKRNPFHPFSCFDTATLAGAALGQTVLAKAVTVAGLTLGCGQRAQRPLRRRAQRGAVLPGVQPPARQLRGRRGACAGTRLAGRRRRAPPPTRCRKLTFRRCS